MLKKDKLEKFRLRWNSVSSGHLVNHCGLLRVMPRCFAICHMLCFDLWVVFPRRFNAFDPVCLFGFGSNPLFPFHRSDCRIFHVLPSFLQCIFGFSFLVRFAQENGKQMMEMYCDQDILILMLNAPFIVRLVLAFATTIMSKRQPLSSKVARLKWWWGPTWAFQQGDNLINSW